MKSRLPILAAAGFGIVFTSSPVLAEPRPANSGQDTSARKLAVSTYANSWR